MRMMFVFLIWRCFTDTHQTFIETHLVTLVCNAGNYYSRGET